MENIIRTDMNELENVLDNIEENEDLSDAEQFEIQNENIGDDMIYTYGPLYVLKDVGLAVIEGVYCVYNEDTDSYDPDWDLTLVYELTDTEPFDCNDYAYFEQGTPMTALHNYLYSKTRVIEVDFAAKSFDNTAELEAV